MPTNTSNMSEKELLFDLLNEEKTLIKEYASDVTESSCPSLRQVLLNNLNECSCDQFIVFDQMRARNMYKTKDAPQSDVQTLKQETQTLKQQVGI